MLLYSPKEQYIIYPLFHASLTINNVIFYLFLAAIITLLIGKGNKKGNIIFNGWGLFSECFFRSILGKIEDFVGSKKSIYLPLFYTIFHLVLFSNLLGLVPYSTTPTVELVITLSISFTLLVGLLLIGFLNHKEYLLAMFLPGGTPLGLIPLKVALEIIAYILRIVSLGLRLAINLITGHLLLKVSFGFIWLGYLKGASYTLLAKPIYLLTIFLILEILIAYLQAYILIFITILTLKDVSKV